MKQIYKIFFFVESTFNQRDYNRFGFEILKSHGYEVHVWDFSPLLVKKAYKQYKAPDPIKYKYHKFKRRISIPKQPRVCEFKGWLKNDVKGSCIRLGQI